MTATVEFISLSVIALAAFAFVYFSGVKRGVRAMAAYQDDLIERNRKLMNDRTRLEDSLAGTLVIRPHRQVAAQTVRSFLVGRYQQPGQCDGNPLINADMEVR